MFKILSTLILVLMIILAPPAVLAYISQDALPTNKIRYKVKRKLEDGILYFAKFNPTTKALFAVTRSKRRFKESTALFTAATRDAKPLKELLVQTQEAFNDIRSVKDQSQRKNLIVKYNDLVKEYKVALAQEEKKLRSEVSGGTDVPDEEETPTPTPTQTPEVTPRPTPTPSASSSGTQTGTPPKLVVSCQADKTSIRVNQSVIWTAKASGGTGSYTYVWSGTNELKGDKDSVTKPYDIPGTKNAIVTVKSGNETVPKVCTTTVTVISLENLCPEPPKTAPSNVWADYTKCIHDNFPEFDGAIDPGTATEFDLLGYGGQSESPLSPLGEKSGVISESPQTGVDVSSVKDAKAELVNINIDGIGIIVATNSAQLSKCTATKYRIALYKDPVNQKIDNGLQSVGNSYIAIQDFYNFNIAPLISSKKSKVKQFEELFSFSAKSQTTASESARSFRNSLNGFDCTTNPDSQVTNFAAAINGLTESFTNYKNALLNLYDKVIEIGPTL